MLNDAVTRTSPSPDRAIYEDRRSHPPLAAELGGVVLLVGAVRHSRFSRAAGRPRLELPFHGGCTIGSLWLNRIEDLRRDLQKPELPLYFAVNSFEGAPANTGSWPYTRVCPDSEQPRGTGGALRDIVAGLPPQSRVLVAPGHSILLHSFGELLHDLAVPDADAVVHTTLDGTPTGIFMIRCDSLAAIPAKGFIDLKEQGLPAIARGGDVRVIATSHPPPMTIRTLDEYIELLRSTAPDRAAHDDTHAADWRLRFNLVEEGAQVDPSARLHDSVVLTGGIVKKNAVVVRSMVCPGGVVAAGASVFDEFVALPEKA